MARSRLVVSLSYTAAVLVGLAETVRAEQAEHRAHEQENMTRVRSDSHRIEQLKAARRKNEAAMETASERGVEGLAASIEAKDVEIRGLSASVLVATKRAAVWKRKADDAGRRAEKMEQDAEQMDVLSMELLVSGSVQEALVIA